MDYEKTTTGVVSIPPPLAPPVFNQPTQPNASRSITVELPLDLRAKVVELSDTHGVGYSEAIEMLVDFAFTQSAGRDFKLVKTLEMQ